jgi:hypothetical protein
MFGARKIIATGEATYLTVTKAMNAHLYHRFWKTEAEEFASALAAAVVRFVWNNPPSDATQVFFSRDHRQRIEFEAAQLSTLDGSLRDMLSGAAYDIAYGRYIAAAGSRLRNRYLSFIRLDAAGDPSHVPAIAALEIELDRLSPAILLPIRSLKSLHLWTPRFHPDEESYFRAVCHFAEDMGVA